MKAFSKLHNTLLLNSSSYNWPFLLNSHEGSCKCVTLGGRASTYPNFQMIVRDARRCALLISQPRHLLGPGWKKSIEKQISLREHENASLCIFSWTFDVASIHLHVTGLVF